MTRIKLANGNRKKENCVVIIGNKFMKLAIQRRRQSTLNFSSFLNWENFMKFRKQFWILAQFSNSIFSMNHHQWMNYPSYKFWRKILENYVAWFFNNIQPTSLRMKTATHFGATCKSAAHFLFIFPCRQFSALKTHKHFLPSCWWQYAIWLFLGGSCQLTLSRLFWRFNNNRVKTHQVNW